MVQVLGDLKKNECVFDVIGLDDKAQGSDALKVSPLRDVAQLSVI